jgi:hypothetical protein
MRVATIDNMYEGDGIENLSLLLGSFNVAEPGERSTIIAILPEYEDVHGDGVKVLSKMRVLSLPVEHPEAVGGVMLGLITAIQDVLKELHEDEAHQPPVPPPPQPHEPTD